MARDHKISHLRINIALEETSKLGRLETEPPENLFGDKTE
jgi:hypothetical protein